MRNYGYVTHVNSEKFPDCVVRCNPLRVVNSDYILEYKTDTMILDEDRHEFDLLVRDEFIKIMAESEGSSKIAMSSMLDEYINNYGAE